MVLVLTYHRTGTRTYTVARDGRPISQVWRDRPYMGRPLWRYTAGDPVFRTRLEAGAALALAHGQTHGVTRPAY
jgi:hypothetical protein